MKPPEPLRAVPKLGEPQASTGSEFRALKVALWAYFFLLPMEGVLRKWILPGWSDALFLVRDPLVLIVYGLAWRCGMFPRRPAIVVLYAIAVAALLCSFGGDAPAAVIFFGLRTDFLHVPLVFVIAAAFDRDDVVAVGRWCLVLSAPIVLLMVLQFNAGPDDPINVGVGGRVGGQLMGAMGHIRPPGPFSFITDVASFFSLTSVFVAYGWFHRGVYRRSLLVAASIALAVVLPVSISRLVLFDVLVVAIVAITIVIHDARKIPVALGVTVIGALLVTLIASFGYFDPMVTRWDEAATVDGGNFHTNVIDRVIADFSQPLTSAAQVPWFGHGIGLGTVAGARLATGNRVFLLAETELARNILELGPVIGFAYIGWRAWLALRIVVVGWRCFTRSHDELAWLLAGACVPLVLYGQWGPATQLGFAVYVAGLSFASANEPRRGTDHSALAVDDPPCD